MVKNNGFPWFKHFAVPFIHTFLWIENLKHSETSNLPKVTQSSAQPVLFKESGPGDQISLFGGLNTTKHLSLMPLTI